MKCKISVFLIVGLVVCLSALTILAQAEEQKGQLWFVDQYVVKPSMVGEFEAGVKEWIAQCTRHNYPYRWNAQSSEDFLYLFFTPVDNFADIDNMDKADAELAKKIGEEQMQALMKRFEGTYDYYRHYMARSLPELSYTPESPRLKPEEGTFVNTDFYYIQPGKEKEFEEVNKEWVALVESKNISDGYSLAVRVMGNELPVYIGNSSGKNAADLFSQGEKNWELMKDEGEALWEKTMALCRKFESRNSWRRPDLSYIPKEKQTAK